jgi:hypothetical protein
MSYEEVKRYSGWYSDCPRSPKPSPSTIPARLLAEDDGWVDARYDRAGLAGWEYALTPGCYTAGFANVAAATYYRRVRRQVVTR